MCILRHGGIFALVPAAMVLGISFFVLLTARKSDSQGLKNFGFAVAVLLWISSALIFVGGLTGYHPMMKRTHMMGGKTCHSMMGSEMQQQMSKETTVK